MARPLRIEYPGALYHVMNRGANHIPIFIDGQGDRSLFKKTLADAVRLWKIRIHAYSLMENHYHLLMETPLGNLSRAMRHIDGVFTQRINKSHNRDGPLLRGRYKSILVQKESYFLELVRYIHLNGVRAQIVPSAQYDINSSHPDYLAPTRAPWWLHQDLVLSYFSDHGLNARQKLDCFVNLGTSKDLEKIFSKNRWPPILGPKDFIDSIRQQFKLDSPSKIDAIVPQRKEIRRENLHSTEEVIKALCQEYGIKENQWQELATGPDKEEEFRWTLIYLLRTKAQKTFREISELLGEGSVDSARKYMIRKNLGGGDRMNRLYQRLNLSQMSNVRT